MRSKELLGAVVGVLISKLIEKILGGKRDGTEHRN